MVSERYVVLSLFMVVAWCGGSVAQDEGLMSAADALAMPQPEADFVIPYDCGANQFGELRLPDREGPYPVVLVIHGGCWLAQYDLGYMSALADALTTAGVATWSIEYRRLGDDGGGWPGTFQDVADAADYLHELARDHDLDLDRVAAVGHSAGGHLALWLAGRKWLEAEDPFRGDAPLALNGVVALAAITDLAAYVSPEGCGSAVPGLLGGEPRGVVDRLKRSSPIAMVPFGISQTLVVAEHDSIVPEAQARSFRDAAGKAGDAVSVIEISGAGHFELVDPTHAGFEVIRREIMDSLEPSWNE